MAVSLTGEYNCSSGTTSNAYKRLVVKISAWRPSICRCVEVDMADAFYDFVAASR